MRLFPTWKTLTLGAYSDTKGYEDGLKKYGVDIVANTDELVLGTHKGAVEIAYLNGFNLQHAMNVHRRVLYQTARMFGLEPCPDEAVLALAFTLGREDVEAKLPFVVATSPRPPTGGSPYVATREDDEKLFVFERGGYYCNIKVTAVINDGMWSPAMPWVFMRGPRAI